MKYNVSYEIEADNEQEAYEGIPSDAFAERVSPNTNSSTDDYEVPFGHSVIVGLTDGTYVLAKVTGWCREEPLHLAAKHIQLPKGETVMIAHTPKLETANDVRQ